MEMGYTSLDVLIWKQGGTEMSSGHYNSCFPGYTMHMKLVHQQLCAAENPQTVKNLVLHRSERCPCHVPDEYI